MGGRFAQRSLRLEPVDEDRQLPGVFAPRSDTWLLADCMERELSGAGSAVLELCTGSGAIATRAALCGAVVTAIGGLEPRVVARQAGPLGPLLSARAAELESRGLLAPGQRHEQMLVIRGEHIRDGRAERARGPVFDFIRAGIVALTWTTLARVQPRRATLRATGASRFRRRGAR